MILKKLLTSNQPKMKRTGALLTSIFLTAFLLAFSLIWFHRPQSLESQAKDQSCSRSFGPMGNPNSTWDTAEEILKSLNNNGIPAIEIYRFTSGWEGHVLGLPFNDFPIEPGEGYLIRIAQKSMKPLHQNLKYSPVNNITLKIPYGWTLISLPENLLPSLGKSQKATGEDLCQSINSQNGQVTQVVAATVCSNLQDMEPWETYDCGVNANRLILKAGEAYFVRATNYSTWQLP